MKLKLLSKDDLHALSALNLGDKYTVVYVQPVLTPKAPTMHFVDMDWIRKKKEFVQRKDATYRCVDGQPEAILQFDCADDSAREWGKFYCVQATNCKSVARCRMHNDKDCKRSSWINVIVFGIYKKNISCPIVVLVTPKLGCNNSLIYNNSLIVYYF